MYSIFPKQTLMCNTIVNKFLFAAICLVLDWIQSNQSGFPLKVAKKLSEIFLGPSLLQDRFWSEKIFRLLISQFYLLIDLGIKNYLTFFSSSIQKMKPIVKIIDNWKNYTKEFNLDIHSFPLKIPTIFKKQWLRISRMPCKKIWVHFFLNSLEAFGRTWSSTGLLRSNHSGFWQMFLLLRAICWTNWWYQGPIHKKDQCFHLTICPIVTRAATTRFSLQIWFSDSGRKTSLDTF